MSFVIDITPEPTPTMTPTPVPPQWLQDIENNNVQDNTEA